MTDIFVYCPTCNREDGQETLALKAILVNGVMEFHLECGHTVVEKFK